MTKIHNPRRTFVLTESQIDKASKLASLTGHSMSSLLRSWILNYLEHGSPVESTTPERAREVQVVVERDVVRRAEARAAAEGITLLEVIRHEIAAIDTI